MPPFLAFLLHPTVEHKILAFPVAAAAAAASGGADIVNEKCWSLTICLRCCVSGCSPGERMVAIAIPYPGISLHTQKIQLFLRPLTELGAKLF